MTSGALATVEKLKLVSVEDLQNFTKDEVSELGILHQWEATLDYGSGNLTKAIELSNKLKRDQASTPNERNMD